MAESALKTLADHYRPAPRVRFNSEDFGFIVAFPDGDIVLAGQSAASVLHAQVARGDLEPHLLPTLHVPFGFHLATPPLVWLELTRKCNLACPHCYIDAGRSRHREMPTERWTSLLDEMAEMGVWAVAFTGGEPTLQPGFFDLVVHARSRDLLVGVATHGMFLTDELPSSLPQDGVIISVSIDDLHVGHRGHDCPTEMAKAAILRAQKLGFLTNVIV